jgi:hypothetical protein
MATYYGIKVICFEDRFQNRENLVTRNSPITTTLLNLLFFAIFRFKYCEEIQMRINSYDDSVAMRQLTDCRNLVYIDPRYRVAVKHCNL